MARTEGPTVVSAGLFLQAAAPPQSWGAALGAILTRATTAAASATAITAADPIVAPRSPAGAATGHSTTAATGCNATASIARRAFAPASLSGSRHSVGSFRSGPGMRAPLLLLGHACGLDVFPELHQRGAFKCSCNRIIV
eukprot:scaffold7125_cov118-Isochrysis_galbana.AAC.7